MGRSYRLIGKVRHLMVDPGKLRLTVRQIVRALRHAPEATATREHRTGAVHDPPREVPRPEARDGAVAGIREQKGLGGYPLLLMHGYPDKN